MCIAAAGGLGGIFSMLGSVVGAIGQMQAANAQAQSARYQAAVAEQNSRIAQRNAADSIARGEAEEEEVRQRSRQLVSRQRAVMGANGIEISSGSALDVLGDTASIGELDALTTRGNYARESISYIAQSNDFKANAELDKMRARAAQSAGAISAFSTVLGGFGSLASRWYS